MSITNTVTKLPLATFARLLGMNPLHFEGVSIETNPHCPQIMPQYSWQDSDHVSREEIAIAIKEAEDKIESQLGYRLAPCWEVDEWVPTGQPFQPEYYFQRPDMFMNGRGRSIQAGWGYFISGGIEAKSLIEAAATIVWSDEDNDGYTETGTVLVSTSITDINEVELYYPDHEGAAEFQIRPINVSISGGNATITFRRELAVIESLLAPVEEVPVIDGNNDANFLATVDVYRHYNDPSTQVTQLWEPLTFGCSCGTGGCSRCAYSAATGCLFSRGDPRQSILVYQTSNWDVDSGTFVTAPWPVNRNPDITRLYYKSGWRDKSSRYGNSRMSAEWERAVTYMAAAVLDRPPCDCSADVWQRWRRDLTLVDGSDENDANPIFRQPTGTLDNPFGTRRGEVNAWRMVRDKIIGHAVLVL